MELYQNICARMFFFLILPDSDSYRGFLLPIGGEGDEPFLRIGRGTSMPLQGTVDLVPLLGTIAGCHGSVLWLSERGATAGCRCRVPL